MRSTPVVSDQTIARLGALFLISGGLLGAASHLLHPWMPPSTPQDLATYAHRSPLTHVILLIAVVLVSIGLPVLGAFLRATTGVATLVAIPLLFVGLVLYDMLHCPIEFGLVPLLPSLDYGLANKLVGGIYGPPSLYFKCNIAGAPVLIIGIVLLFFGTARSTAVPRWPAYLLLAVPVLMVCAFLPLQNIVPMLAEHAFPPLIYLGLAGYGIALLSRTEFGAEGASTLRV